VLILPFLLSRLLVLNMEGKTVPHTSGNEKTPRRSKFFKHHSLDGYPSWEIIPSQIDNFGSSPYAMIHLLSTNVLSIKEVFAKQKFEQMP